MINVPLIRAKHLLLKTRTPLSAEFGFVDIQGGYTLSVHTHPSYHELAFMGMHVLMDYLW